MRELGSDHVEGLCIGKGGPGCARPKIAEGCLEGVDEVYGLLRPPILLLVRSTSEKDPFMLLAQASNLDLRERIAQSDA